MFEAFFPHITLPSGKTDYRMGDGIAMICAGQTMLVDGFQGGQPTDGLMAWLAQKNVKDIDIAVLTHPHWDHYNGLLQIADDKKFKIKQLVCYNPLTLSHGVGSSDNGRAVKEDIENMQAFIKHVVGKGASVRYVVKGDKIEFGDITFRVYRDQPTAFTHLDGGNAYAFTNDGSLCLYSPETELLLCGDGPGDLEEALEYYGGEVSGYDVSHHGNSCSEHNAKALARHRCVVAWQSCIERSGAGTTSWTAYGSRRVKEQGIPVWQQDVPIYIEAYCGRIYFRQGSKTISKAVPYKGEAAEGWQKNSTGWWYRRKDGSWPTGWAKLKWSGGTNWFYFDNRGYMMTGWQYVSWTGGKNWFYLDPKTGAMLTGWIKDKDWWYYLDPKTGAMQTGWLEYKGKKCYLEPVSRKNQGHAYCDVTAVIDGKTYIFNKDCYATEITPQKSASMDGITKVVDLSEHNAKDIDWKKVKDAGYAVILRIGIRGSVKSNTQYYGKIREDFNFASYLAGVIKAGIPYSVYFFPTSISDKEAEEEAAWIISRVSGLQLSLPVYLDSELVDKGNGRADGLSKADRTRYLRIITERLMAAGIQCGIYASTSWLNNKLDMSQLQEAVRKNTWVAQYASACEYKGDYLMWQYTNKGNVPGINGNVDVSKVIGTSTRQQAVSGDRAAIVSEAISHIGVQEGTILHHKIIDRYNSRKPLPRGYAVKYTDLWCATFISYLAIICGLTDIIPIECSCPKMIELAKQMGIWVEDDSYVPQPGDIILYDWQDSGSGDNTGTADHIGLVEKVEDGNITVIEGNYSDSVKRRVIAVNGRYIRGYIVPHY